MENCALLVLLNPCWQDLPQVDALEVPWYLPSLRLKARKQPSSAATSISICRGHGRNHGIKSLLGIVDDGTAECSYGGRAEDMLPVQRMVTLTSDASDDQARLEVLRCTCVLLSIALLNVLVVRRRRTSSSAMQQI